MLLHRRYVGSYKELVRVNCFRFLDNALTFLSDAASHMIPMKVNWVCQASHVVIPSHASTILLMLRPPGENAKFMVMVRQDSSTLD